MHKTTNDWVEKLPANCPPKMAKTPNDFNCYRLTSTALPTEKDFHSHRKIYPHKTFHTTECRVCSVSVFTNLKDLSKIRKLPSQKSKVVVKLILGNASGVIKQTGNKESHYSWWLKKNYLTNIEIEVA